MTEITATAYVGIAGRNERFVTPSPERPYYVDGGDGGDVVVGYDFPDHLLGGLGRDLVLGDGGNDIIFGDRFWNDEAVNVNPALEAGADLLLGQSGDDVIYGGGGNNFINGGSGVDTIHGGSGHELLEGGQGDDRVEGGSGNDKLFGGSDTQANASAFAYANVGDFTTTFDGTTDAAQTSNIDVSSHGGVDRALTDTGVDWLDGGEGNDVIDGQDGADVMLGGLGNDRYYVDNGQDVIREAVGEGTDYVLASTSYTLKANVSVERLLTTHTSGVTTLHLTGNEFNQRIDGNQAGNKLIGQGGNDTLVGYGGNDALYGGAGRDALTGGDGNDSFIFDTALSATSIDAIKDFSNVGQNDVFRLDDAIFSALGGPGVLAAGAFQSNTTGLAQDADDRIIFETDTGRLFYDSNGNAAGGAIQIATVTLIGATILSAADFLVI